jgi:Phage integrase family
MVDQGVHLRVIQEIMGHSDVRVTEQYTHIASLAVREPAGLMGAALLGNSADAGGDRPRGGGPLPYGR